MDVILLVRDDAGNVIVSRCFITFDKTSLFDIRAQIDTIRAQREVSRAQPINIGKSVSEWPFFVHGPIFYEWELASVQVEELLQNVILGLASVCFISLLFIPYPIGALLLTPVVASIYLELVAMLKAASVPINGVSMSGLVMSIGLVCDYTMHTFLGVLPLSFTDSEAFRTMFYTFLGVSVLSSLHGLVLVPVILSIMGPREDVIRRAQTTSHPPKSEIEPPQTEECEAGPIPVDPTEAKRSESKHRHSPLRSYVDTLKTIETCEI